MHRPKNGLQIAIQTGSPVEVGEYRLTPQSQSVSLRLPFGGFVYNRPVAVLVEKGENVERIPIVDVTRVVLMGLAGFSIIVALVFASRSMRRK